MNLIRNIFWISLLFSSLSFAAQNKTILLLHSYNKGLTWTDDLNEAIVDELKNNSELSIDIRIEYLDTKRFEDESYIQSYENFIISKYKDTPLDIIISTDNAAFEFLRKHSSDFVKNTPVVFCGLNNIYEYPSNFTGIIEDIDIEDNLKSILSIHPDYKNIYIAIDNSITGKVIKQQTNSIITADFPDLRYEYLTDYSFDNFKSKISTLAEGDILLLIIFNYDNNGLVIPYDGILDEILPYCAVPIYGPWGFYLNKGIIGGKITNAYYHGKEAGIIANKVLLGINPNEIPVKPGPTKYIFDNKYLKQYNINTNDIPKEAIILNLPENLIKKNIELFIFLVSTFVILSLTIIFLLILIKNQKKARSKEFLYLEEIQNKKLALQNALKKAHSANELQRSFIANVSHEIRTPMNGILGFSDLLEEYSNLNDESLDYIQHIRTNGKLLMAIIDDILEISRIENNITKKQIAPVNINSLIDNILNAFTVKEKRLKGITIETEFHLPGSKATLYSDETKLKQILSNLIDNAIKFTHKGNILISYELKDSIIEFRVKDSGIGIKPEDFEFIFSRFGQVEKGLSRQYGGTGLGLSITKAFVELLGGKIWINSIIDIGTTFIFTHPANFVELKENENIPGVNSIYNWNNRRVLIVEDEPTNLIFLKAVLEPTGINVLHAGNGTEAIKICTNNTDLDIVLMDIKMPDMDGFEATKIIKQILPSIPVVAQTAYTISYEHDKALESGIEHTIHKPIEKAVLLSLINNLLS